MKLRKHICLDPSMREKVEQWATEGFRSFSAQITMLVQQEIDRREETREGTQVSDNGKEMRAE
jgi:hypothetical protein